MPSLQTARDKIAQQVKVDVNLRPVDTEAMAHAVSRSFISDTVTVPTKEMYAYATLASLGDDVYEEPSTLHLESHVARLFGKEAALFVPSGSMSNQIALRAHLTQPPHSVLCDIRSHINRQVKLQSKCMLCLMVSPSYEAGGAAYHSQAAVTAVIPSNGHHLTLLDVEKHVITGSDVHFAPTRVIALENTILGCIIPQDEILKISELARSEGIRMHLDGARIWHVAAETGTSLSELCDPFDSISCCFSKGLGLDCFLNACLRTHPASHNVGAPVGSCLVGSTEFISRARWLRKLFGGGMRQTGILAGAAAYALTHNFELLPGVHDLTRKLEQGLQDIGVGITSPAETCMVKVSYLESACICLVVDLQVFYNPTPIGLDYMEIMERAALLPDPIKVGGSRLVVHIQTSPEAVDDFINLLKNMADEKKAIQPNGSTEEPPVEGGADRPSTDYRDVYVRVRGKPKT
ncbi:pyridoxal phosphate-dependent transferase [Gautieria morchelliformis]|nr:pyridoxal phosphate-dependent transferase [Gautieria morchelliformis]